VTYYLYVLLFPNGKRYFGISYRPVKRFAEHLQVAENGNKLPLYKAIRRYGAANVVMKVLVVGKLDYIRALETVAIAHFRSLKNQNGYNVSLGGDTSPAEIPGVREKIAAGVSAALKGTKQSSKHIARRTASRIANGKRWSKESRNRGSFSQQLRVQIESASAHRKRLRVLRKCAETPYERTPQNRSKSRIAAHIRNLREANKIGVRVPTFHPAYVFGPGSFEGLAA